MSRNNKTDYIGMLMKVVTLQNGNYIFEPITVIEGNYYQEEGSAFFCDNNEIAYSLCENIIIDQAENDNPVGFIKSKKDLEEQYATTNLKEAINNYFEEITNSDNIYFGITDEKTGKITLIGRNAPLVEENYQNEVADCPMISFAADQLLELLNNNPGDVVKEQLLDIVNSAITSINNAERDVDLPNDIKETFTSRYNNIVQAKNIKKLKEAIRNAQEIYLALITELDDCKLTGFNIEEAKSLIYEFNDAYDKILSIDDFKSMKNKVKEILAKENIYVEKLISLYSNRNSVGTNNNTIFPEPLNVKALKEFLDKSIIGQEAAKRAVILSISHNLTMDGRCNKDNCLLVGPTGSGKTLIAETAAKFLAVPMVSVNTTDMSAAGYKGKDIEDILEDLLAQTAGDLAKAQHGIVIFDELDKKGSKENSDISGKGVLNALLKFIDGTTYKVKFKEKDMIFDTKNLIIIGAGSFSQAVEKYTAIDGYRGTNMGFTQNGSLVPEDISYPTLSSDVLSKYGDVPTELLGRFPRIKQLSGHTLGTLEQILTNSDTSALLIEKAYLLKSNVELTWTDDYLKAVSQSALKEKSGARSLNAIVKKSLEKAEWQILINNKMHQKLTLTGASVADNSQFILVTKQDERPLEKENPTFPNKNTKSSQKVKLKEATKRLPTRN